MLPMVSPKEPKSSHAIINDITVILLYKTERKKYQRRLVVL